MDLPISLLVPALLLHPPLPLLPPPLLPLPLVPAYANFAFCYAVKRILIICFYSLPPLLRPSTDSVVEPDGPAPQPALLEALAQLSSMFSFVRHLPSDAQLLLFVSQRSLVLSVSINPHTRLFSVNPWCRFFEMLIPVALRDFQDYYNQI